MITVKFPKTEIPEYKVWSAMIQRCTNPNTTGYQYYGGRGIKVCARWRKSFANFFKDMGPRPEGRTLDRKRSNGHYAPSNCRWATKQQQIENRRTPGSFRVKDTNLIPPRRRIYDATSVTRVHVYVPNEYLKKFKEFKKQFRAETGQAITLAFLFREGGKNLMKSLRVQMNKARRGILHAKPR